MFKRLVGERVKNRGLELRESFWINVFVFRYGYDIEVYRYIVMWE